MALNKNALIRYKTIDKFAKSLSKMDAEQSY